MTFQPEQVTGPRRIAAALNVLMVAVIAPAVLYHSIFGMPQARTEGAQALLIAALAAVWLALSIRPWASPLGRPWSWPWRALFFVGGNLAMAALMWLWHRPA